MRFLSLCRQAIFLIPLGACSLAPRLEPSPAPATRTGSAERAARTSLLTAPAPPTASMTASPSRMEMFTASFTPAPTEAEEPAVSPSTVPRIYVFPVHPLKDVGFEDGGHSYPAVDIFAQEGDRFVAVTDGIVDFVAYEDRWNPDIQNWPDAGGLAVAIIGDDGVQYYGSHLSAVDEAIVPGIRVNAGQLLGLVGHTGNARTTPPHVHFGISRPTYPEDWKRRRGEVDPYPYLLAWMKGASITPVLDNLPPLP